MAISHSQKTVQGVLSLATTLLSVLFLTGVSGLAQEKEATPDLAGNWKVRTLIEDGSYPSSMRVEEKEGKIVAWLQVELGSDEETKIDNITFGEDGEVTFGLNIAQGDVTVVAKETSPGVLKGNWTLVDGGQEITKGGWEAEKEKVWDPSGQWAMEATDEAGNGMNSGTVKIEKDGKSYEGSLTMEDASETINLRKMKVEGDEINFVLPYDGESILAKGKAVSEDKIAGIWTLGEGENATMKGNWTAERGSASSFDPAGTWDSVATTPEGDLKATVTVTKDGEGYKGTSALDGQEANALKSVAFEKDELTIIVETEYGDAVIISKPEGADTLKGVWSIKDGETEVADGTWTAERKESATVNGDWKGSAEVEGDTIEHKFVLTGEAGEMKGSTVLSGEEKQLKKISFKEGKLQFEVETEYGQVSVEAKLGDDGGLTGKWTLQEDGTEGDWKASRES